MTAMNTDWTLFDNMTDVEVITHAMPDAGVSLLNNGVKVELRMRDGATVPEGFRKAIKLEGQVRFIPPNQKKYCAGKDNDQTGGIGY